MKTTTTPNPSSLSQDSKKKSSKKPLNTATATNNHNSNRKSPIFDCDCFDCYTSFWFRWDSSPNRELIHQVIEAFEDHLTNGEQSKKSTRGKKKDKAGKRVDDKTAIGVLSLPEMREMETPPPEINESSFISPDGAVASSGIADNGEDVEEEKGVKKNEPVAEEAEEEEITVVLRSPAAVSNHKGLARKVLPDVLGLFNSRLWSLWSPNV
ncbi:hypothetical protein JCGZ_17995 [Jatropha curcas]|uniref:Uncharacterized protein n=2 Tax=Jatropha curcas TaxID=180498 RepID=A0A067JSI1_JATCU|nr:hypothetical protein JCGZ_17995 [Jatropha curcas]